MELLIIIVLWLVIASLTACLARFIVVKIAKHNGYTSESMPIKYHAWAIGAYFTVVYPAFYLLNYFI